MVWASRLAYDELFLIGYVGGFDHFQDTCTEGGGLTNSQREIALADKTPVATSSTRYLYFHPENQQLLIKLHKIASVNQLQASGLTFWQKRSWRFQFFSGILREFQVYLEHHYAESNPFLPFIQPVYGLVHTDAGLGMLAEAALGPEGELAPTLRTLMRERQLTPDREELVEEFLTAVLATDLVVGDLNPDNIVLTLDGDGREALRLVDGLGERTWVPIQRWSRSARARQKNRFVRKIRARIPASRTA